MLKQVRVSVIAFLALVSFLVLFGGSAALASNLSLIHISEPTRPY